MNRKLMRTIKKKHNRNEDYMKKMDDKTKTNIQKMKLFKEFMRKKKEDSIDLPLIVKM